MFGFGGICLVLGEWVWGCEHLEDVGLQVSSSEVGCVCWVKWGEVWVGRCTEVDGFWLYS